MDAFLMPVELLIELVIILYLIFFRECELFSIEHNFLFNAAKTQSIYLCPSPEVKLASKFVFSGHLLEFAGSVTYLGHLLHCSLDDTPDIKRATLEMCKKANFVILSTCHPHVKTVLFSSYLFDYTHNILFLILFILSATRRQGHMEVVHFSCVGNVSLQHTI